jgi:hypothetical protein
VEAESDVGDMIAVPATEPFTPETPGEPSDKSHAE